MARRGFWDSFYQGWEQGDKIGERNRGLKQRAEFKKIAGEDQVDSSQYNPEDFTDDAEKAGGVWSEADQAYKLPNGGLQAPTNTPTWDAATNSYQGAQGQSLKPKAQFTLGGQTQAERFTPDQVQDYRNNRMANVYESNGDIDKAMGVRASAQSIKLGKVQYEQAAMQAEQAKNVNKILKINQDVASGKTTEEEGLSQLVSATDPMNKDGLTHGYRPIGNGMYSVTQMKDNKIVGAKELTYDQILQEALGYASPEQFKAMQAQKTADKTFQAGREEFKQTFDADRADTKVTQDNQQTQLKLLQDKFDEDKRQYGQEFALKQQEANSLAGYRRASLSTRNTGNGLNPAQDYALKQQQNFDAAKGEIVTALETGKITEVEASRRLNIIGMKYGGAGRPLQEGKENTKAQDAKMKFIVDNPDATDAQLEQLDIRLGLKPLSFGELGKPNTQATTKPAAKPLDWDKVDNIQRALGGISENRKRAELLQAANEEAKRLGVYNK